MNSADTAAAFAALGHTLRAEVWRILLEYGPLGLPAGTLAARLAIAPSSLSFHLQQMTQGRVLLQRRSSRQVIYMINDEILDSLRNFLNGVDAMPEMPFALNAGQVGDIAHKR